jgi:activator of Hsp90 ATPase-like protein
MMSKLKKYDKDKAVSFSWIDKLKTGEIAKTTASFEVKKRGKGTLLELRHSGFKDPEHFADCSSRWAYYLTNMKSVLDNGKDLRSRYDW